MSKCPLAHHQEPKSARAPVAPVRIVPPSHVHPLPSVPAADPESQTDGSGEQTLSVSWNPVWDTSIGQATIPEAEVMEVVGFASEMKASFSNLLDLTGWELGADGFQAKPEAIPGKAVKLVAGEFVDGVAGPGTSFFAGAQELGVGGGRNHLPGLWHVGLRVAPTSGGAYLAFTRELHPCLQAW